MIYTSALHMLKFSIIKRTKQCFGMCSTLLIPGINSKKRCIISLYNRVIALTGNIHDLPVP